MACGQSAPAGDEPWRASHPDPSGISFDQQAPGLCQLAVRYPDQAPAAIDYLGTTYIQRSRSSRPSTPPGPVVARSGDWTLVRSGGNLNLVTPMAMFGYQPAGNC